MSLTAKSSPLEFVLHMNLSLFCIQFSSNTEDFCFKSTKIMITPLLLCHTTNNHRVTAINANSSLLGTFEELTVRM